MNDSPLIPRGQSRRGDTPLAPEFAAIMKALQIENRDATARDLAKVEPQHGLLEDGMTEVTTKFLANARDSETDLPQYAIVDRHIGKVLDERRLLRKMWQLHSPGPNEYVQIVRKEPHERFLRLEDIYQLAMGHSHPEGQRVFVKDGNWADLRGSNLSAAVKPPQHQRTWVKTELDVGTYTVVKTMQLRLRDERTVRTKYRFLPFMYGKHADGTEIAVKFVSGPIPHEDSGLPRYEIMDKHVGKWLEEHQDQDDPWGWSLSFGAKRKDGTRSPRLIISIADNPQAARVIWELANPGKRVPAQITNTSTNPFDMRAIHLRRK